MPADRQPALEYREYNRLDFPWEEPDKSIRCRRQAHLVNEYDEHTFSQ